MTKFDFTPLALKFGPWSLSKSNVAAQCSLAFEYQYIKKVKGLQSTDSSGRLGQAAHKALELVLKGEDLTRAFTVAAIDCKLTTPETDDLISFRENINDFLRRYSNYKLKHPLDKELVEFKFGLTKDFKPTGFFSKDVFNRGVFDIGMLLKERVWVSLDHKSGAQMHLNKYKQQLDAYSVAAIALEPNIGGVQNAVHFIKDQVIEWTDFISKEEIQDKLVPELVKFINDSASNLEGDPKPTEGFYCKWCSYKSICPIWAK